MDKNMTTRRIIKITLILELILIGIILLCTLYEYHEFLGGGSLKLTSGDFSLDNDIYGWFVIPKLILEYFKVLGYIFIIGVPIIYFGIIVIVIAWNIWINKRNKYNKLWINIIGILPAAILAFKVIKSVISILIINKSILIAVYMFPAIICLIEVILYTILIYQ